MVQHDLVIQQMANGRGNVVLPPRDHVAMVDMPLVGGLHVHQSRPTAIFSTSLDRRLEGIWSVRYWEVPPD